MKRSSTLSLSRVSSSSSSSSLISSLGYKLSFPFLIFLLFFAVVLYPYLKNWKHRKALLKLPGLPLHGFFLGNLPDIPKEGHEKIPDFLGKLKIFGEVGFFRTLLGPIPLLGVVAPDLAREIMSTSKHTKKGFVYSFLVPWLGDGLLLSWGEKWKVRRRLITPAFHFQVLQRFFEVMNEQSDILISRIDEKVGKGNFEIFELITACTLDIICETAMGKKVNAQSKNKLPYVDAVFQMSNCVVYRTERPWLANDFLYSLTQNGKVYQKSLKELHSFTLKVIEERKVLLEEEKKKSESEKKVRPAFLDLLLTSEVDGKPLGIQDVREEVDTFMFEGHDTTSASLAWTIQLLGSHPEIQTKLQEELDQVIGDKTTITSEMLSEMKYLEMVAKESLRLFPSVPAIARVTTEDINFKGYFIPKGTNVTLSIFGLHRNPYQWENADDFIPERWESEEEKDPFLYVPFSAGPRNCIGQKFAQNEEKLILAKIFHKFRVTSKEKEPRTYPELILRPKDGIFVAVAPRTSFLPPFIS